MSWTIANGAALIDGMFRASPVHLAEGKVAKGAAPGARLFDATDRLVLPGAVDIHGDAFERQIMPRPGVSFPLETALLDTDRQMLASGITTALYGLTVSWEPGLRSLEAAERFVDAWIRLRPRLAVDARLHIRWETFAFEAIGPLDDWLALEPTPLVAFNDHTTATIEKRDRNDKIERLAERSGLTPQAYLDLLDEVWERREEAPAAIVKVATMARARGATLLAHDEDSPEQRRWFRELGAVASEFPLTRETAIEAREAGEQVILGAPNVVRGGSHTGAVNATEEIAAGRCSVLASDYYYPALPLAPFRLVERGVMALPEAWALVSKNAAIAAGLEDRGAIAPGARGDVIVVDASDPATPRVTACFVAGEKVYEAR